MAKYVHLSRIYLGDEELYELLAPKNIAHRELLRMARRRGLLFSEKSHEAEVRARLSILPSDYPTVHSIFKAIARPDAEERSTPTKIINCAKNDLVKLATTVRDERATKNNEQYNVTQTPQGTIRVEVTYIDVDPSRAVIYSRRERNLVVELSQTGDTIAIQHTANDRAKDIVAALKKAIATTDETGPKEERISMKAIRSAPLRSRLFLNLIRKVEGYTYENTTHVNVDRRFPKDSEEEQPEASDSPKASGAKAVEKIKGVIHKLALEGEQVMATDFYQRAFDTGYYISNIEWSCTDTKDSRIHVDFEAGFRDPVSADEFTFDVVRQWRYKKDAPDEEETIAMAPSDKRRLKELLQNAAFAEFQQIQLETEATNNKQAEG